MTPLFTPPTWRALGLSVALSYTSLGLFEILFPQRAAAEFFNLPVPIPAPASTFTPNPNYTAAVTTSENEAVAIMGPLLGVRDLSMAAAMGIFAYQGKWNEMGTVILAGTLLCVADCAVIWRRMGERLGTQFVVGAVGWTVIGGVLCWY